MKIKTVFKSVEVITLALFSAVVLVACSNSKAQVAPATTADSCPTAPAGMQLLTNKDHGYCVLYPSGYVVERPNENEAVLVVGSLLDVEHPRVYIKVQEAAGRTADQAADALVADFDAAHFDIARSRTTIGGEEAALLDKVPGQDTSRQVMVVRGERLYQLTFVPASEDYGEVYAQMKDLYAKVIDSFTFLSQ